jgi:hypothetical protein
MTYVICQLGLHTPTLYLGRSMKRRNCPFLTRRCPSGNSVDFYALHTSAKILLKSKQEKITLNLQNRRSTRYVETTGSNSLTELHMLM